MRASVKKRESLLSLLLTSIFYLYLQFNLFGYSASIGELFGPFFTLLPILGLWFILRVFVTPLQSALSICLTVSIISYISLIKSSETNLPLSWTDLSTPKDTGFFLKYVSPSPMLFLILVLGVFTLTSLVLIERPRLSRYRTLKSVFALSIVIPLLFVPLGRGELSWNARNYLAQQGVYYISWGWDANVSKNGILLHLLHTSTRPVPNIPSLSEESAYKRLTNPNSTSEQEHSNIRPRTVVFILCESCWWDSVNFTNAFDSFSRMGFRETRLISPVYGGLTVNASLELLSGLPMNTQHLGGVIYQEYADLLSPKILNLASSFRDAGYTTVAGHNWSRAFWRRDEVKPKLGFQEFISLENLDFTGEGYPRDHVLFNYILKELSFEESPTFLYLTTMFSHSPYGSQGIEPEIGYQKKLSSTAKDIEEFSANVLSRDPDALIVIVGDHKPSLGSYFKKRGVIPESEFELESSRRIFNFSPEIWGDVPALVYQRDVKALDSLIDLTMDKPFYCFNHYSDVIFLNFSSPVRKFVAEQQICDGYAFSSYKESADSFPSWLYFETLLRNRE